MKKSELLKACRFFRDGGEQEAVEAYKKSNAWTVCWLGESLWVSSGGETGKDQEELEDLVSGLAPDLPLALRVYVGEAYLHFNGRRLLYKDRARLVSALRDEVFPFYAGSQTI